MQYRYYCKNCDWEGLYDDASEGGKDADKHLDENPAHKTAMKPKP